MRGSCISWITLPKWRSTQDSAPFVINDAAPTITNGATLRADVCIVGGGPIGLAIATELASAQCRVIVLESGSRVATPSGHALASAEQLGDLW